MLSTAKFTVFGLFLGALLILPGKGYAGEYPCQTQTRLDRNWGRSFETAKYLQFLNPDAGKDLRPVTGIEGRVGERIMEGYVKGPSKKKDSDK